MLPHSMPATKIKPQFYYLVCIFQNQIRLFKLRCLNIQIFSLYNISIKKIMTGAARTGYIICLVLTILLVGLHFAVAGAGHVWYKDRPESSNGVNYQNKNFDQNAAFIIIAAILTFIISIALLIGLFSDKINPRIKHILATLNLILEFALAVVVSLLASTSSNERNLYQQIFNTEYDDLNLYYRLAVADAVITFVLQVVYLAVIYLQTLKEIENGLTLTNIVPEIPVTADRLR